MSRSAERGLLIFPRLLLIKVLCRDHRHFYILNIFRRISNIVNEHDQRVVLEYLFRTLHSSRENKKHLSNDILRMIEAEGFVVWYSDTPKEDGYHMAIALENGTVVLRDVDLGLDFSKDPYFADLWA